MYDTLKVRWQEAAKDHSNLVRMHVFPNILVNNQTDRNNLFAELNK